MTYRTLFAEVRERPGLYGLDGSFREFCAFVTGADAGNDWQLLTGFRELLVVRVGTGNNLTWVGLVLRLAFPDAESGWPGLLTTPDGDRAAVATLFRLLDEFLERRAAPGEPAGIFAEYQAWLQAQPWYQP